MNTSGNSYSSLYPFPFDLNQDAQWQEQEYQAKTCVSQDETMENDSGVKLSVWHTEERFLGHHHRYCSDNSDLSNNCTPRFKDDLKLHPSPCPEENRSNSSSCKDTIRVCADCNTTKTPLWRGGPNGPKSLCNACGIRQRKARRAMAAARAAEVNGSVVVAESLSTRPSTKKSKVRHKAKGLKNGKSKVSCQSQGRKKPCFEDLRRMLSKNSAFHRVFPQDEKEAAVLLMALSYGLVHG